MAIVINGSGTVTGLAVGGLPDGTVDDGTVASGIASSKLTGALPAISGASLTGFTDAQMPTGSVLQVQYMYTGATTSVSSQTYADTGVNVSITPTSTSSKIMAFANVGGCSKTATGNAYMALQIVRGSTAIHIFEGEGGYNATGGVQSFGSCVGAKLDSPSTTSAVNYKIQMKNLGSTGAVSNNGSGALSSITLMEIAG